MPGTQAEDEVGWRVVWATRAWEHAAPREGVSATAALRLYRVRRALATNKTTNLEAKFLLAAEQKKTGGSPSLRKLEQ